MAEVNKPVRRWVRVKELAKSEKKLISLRCKEFIAEQLAARFLAEIRPTEWNYSIALQGKWRGSKYGFFIG